VFCPRKWVVLSVHTQLHLFGWHGFFGLKKRRLLTVSKIIYHIDDFFFLGSMDAVFMGLAWMMNISSLSHSWCAGLGVTKCYSCMTRFMVLVITSGVAGAIL
jgi:hypothetical protein